MLRSYRISSGEFLLVIKEKNYEMAATEAIRLHRESCHHSRLGEITMVEFSSGRGAAKFFFTKNILNSFDSVKSKSLIHK